MNRQELTKKLSELGVSQSAYSLDGPYVEGIMLEITDNYRPGDIAYKEWRVFEHERGARYNDRGFSTESEALNDIYERFETTKRKLSPKH